MPEYLAPGVYVEETSFRSKSIEGVSTSTTGFVGPTLSGPVGGTPELITSLGDFERIYGGLGNLSFGVNYMAHAARAYFNEGGARLYVSRVYQPGVGDGRASSSPFVVNADPAERARFVARMPGSGGNGRITLSLLAAQATQQTLERAREGTLVRIGGASPAGSAQATGGLAPFRLTNNSVLRLNLGGPDIDITFQGTPSEVVADDPLADPVVISPANATLNVNIDGVQQSITLQTGLSRDDFVTALNRELRGGYARLTELAEPGAEADRLVIGTDRRGSLSAVSVSANPDLEINSAKTAQGNAPGNPNNVGDLLNVTADEINTLLTAATGGRARAALSPANRLIIATVATGAAATLAVGDSGAANSANGALGLTPAPAVIGTDGTPVTYFVKDGSTYVNPDGGALNLGGVGSTAEILTLSAVAEDSGGHLRIFEDMAFDRRHPRWLGSVLAPNPTRRSDALENTFAADIGAGVSAFELRAGLFTAGNSHVATLTGGSDGQMPVQGAETTPGSYMAALFELEKLEDISIVAAPGSSAYTDAQGIQGALVAHAEKRKSYRIAVLDTPADQTGTGARAVKARIDSKYAALYYPWVVVSNPLAQPGDESIPRELALPPSGFICGIYARNDIERGVYKAPANEVVRSALRFESDVNFAQQEVLNPLGVNCLRYFVGRGYRVWGARTASSDPEWKYVNVRRYFNYLEASVDRGTQWAVFEPNGERLWRNITETVESFLYNEWVSGALLGTKPAEAFFVRCDRSTMTQNDLDNGRLICLVGVAVIKPAEFVIFRIGQKTADARS